MNDIKKLIADEKLRIELHDRIEQNLKTLLEAFKGSDFSNEVRYSPEALKKRIVKCEELTQELCKIQALLGYWGSDKQQQLFTYPIKSIAYALKNDIETNHIKAAKLYSITLLFYYGGISAVAADNYQWLFELYELKIPAPIHTQEMVYVNKAVNLFNDRNTAFYNVALENTNHKTPMSEYLHNQTNLIFQELILNDTLFEYYFDRFELMIALDHIHREYVDIPEKTWTPIGRFGLKENGNDPFKSLIKEANQKKNKWPPLMAGFFDGNYDRFLKICDSFQNQLRIF